MDLLNKAEEIAMTSLSILYNTNLVPLVICVLTLVVDLEQQRLGVEKKLQQMDTSILARRKKNRRKVALRIVIREVMLQPYFEESVRMRFTLPEWELGSPSRLSELQSSIVGVKTPHIVALFISLENY
jgi:hypothetical protein